MKHEKASVWNPKWKYTSSAATDISVTIAREKRRLAAEAEARKARGANVRDFSEVFKGAGEKR